MTIEEAKIHKQKADEFLRKLDYFVKTYIKRNDRYLVYDYNILDDTIEVFLIEKVFGWTEDIYIDKEQFKMYI